MLIPIVINKYQTDNDTDFSRNTGKYRLMPINTDYRLNKSVNADKLYRYRLSNLEPYRYGEYPIPINRYRLNKLAKPIIGLALKASGQMPGSALMRAEF